MVRLVAGLPASLGIIDTDDIPAGDAGLKILRIDGKGPSDTGYALVTGTTSGKP
jgi:hypothetical protein